MYFEMMVEEILVLDACPGRGISMAPENGQFVVADVTAYIRALISPRFSLAVVCPIL